MQTPISDTEFTVFVIYFILFVVVPGIVFVIRNIRKGG